MYVDDPLLIIRGADPVRNRLAAVVVLAWRVLGVNLAFAKAQLGSKVDWIGWELDIQYRRHLSQQSGRIIPEQLEGSRNNVLGSHKYVLGAPS